MSFENFWLYTEKALEENYDVGFELYSKGHLLWLLALAIGALIIIPVYLRGSHKKQEKMRKFFAAFLLVTEIIKDIIVVVIGAPITAYLPLHLCGYAIFFLLIDAYFPKQKITGQLVAYAFGPGALAALLFCAVKIIRMEAVNLTTLNSTHNSIIKTRMLLVK
jgi:hypothetical protein